MQKAKNIVYKVDGKVVSQLQGNVKSGSTVEVSFKTDAGTTPTRFSLVSYEAPASYFTEENAEEQVPYDEVTETYSAGTHSMKVTIPKYYFQVDFVYGCVIEQFGPAGTNNYYGKQSRLIAHANGGNKPPKDNKKITICHIPPGNPDNAHTITISENAWPAHQKHHGDYVGACKKDSVPPVTECDTCDTAPPFPVKLIKFSGVKISPNVVKLQWTTTSEINNDYIAIEKSTDVNNWQEVCRVPGAPGGYSNTPRDYSCEDKHADDGGQNNVYYRPKQVDFNGTYEYFNMIRIRLQDAAYQTSVDPAYPNPTTDNRIRIPYNAAENALFNIRVMTLDGRTLLTNRFVAQTGHQVVDLELPETTLKSGFYILEVQSDDQVFRQKVYKQ